MAQEKNELNNYIPINRKIFSHPLWQEERPLSRFEAWIDLIRSARFEITEARELIDGKLVRWNRGEIPASLRYLAERWKWSKNKVDSFIKLLEKDKMIKRRTADGTSQTIITLCNYESYNGKGKVKGQQPGQTGDSEGTGPGQWEDKVKKVNKDNNDKEGEGAGAPTPSPDEVLFKGFSGWLNTHASKVQQMKEPITLVQFIKLRKDYPGEEGKMLIAEICLAMQNKKTLLKDYESANLTIRGWINIRNKRALENGVQTQPGTNGTTGTSAGIYKAREKEQQQQS